MTIAMKDAPLPDYLTPPEIAKLWRVRTSKVLSWIHSGQLQAFNVAEKANESEA